MSATVPILALSALIALALIARQYAYVMTSTSLMFTSAALAAWLLVAYAMFG